MSEQKKSTAQSVLETIEKEHVAPTPRWHFIVRNTLVWISGIVFLIAGAISVSLIIFAFSGSAWQLRGVIGRGAFEHMMIIMPIIWIIALIVFVAAADYALRHTKKGYRYPLWGIVLVLIVGSLIGGTVLHAMRADRLIDESFGRHLPQYKTVEKRRAILMHQPKEGSIMGRVTSISEGHFTLVNRHFEEEWLVESNDTFSTILQDVRVLVVGKKNGENKFKAEEIIVLPHRNISDEQHEKRMQYEEGLLKQEKTLEIQREIEDESDNGDRVYGADREQYEKYKEQGNVRGIHHERK